jgi:hypothetical protein
MLINEVFDNEKTGSFISTISRGANFLQKGRGALRAGAAMAGIAATAAGNVAPFIGPAMTLMRLPQFGDQLVNNMQEYAHSVQRGEDAWITLDAVDTAITLQTIEGDYFTTVYALDLLLQ